MVQAMDYFMKNIDVSKLRCFKVEMRRNNAKYLKYEDLDEAESKARKVAEKLKKSSGFSDGGFLGLELSFNNGYPGFECVFFAYNDDDISPEDIQWALDPFAESVGNESTICSVHDLFEGDRKVYQIYTPCIGIDNMPSEIEKSTGNVETKTKKKYFDEVSFIKGTDIIIQVIMTVDPLNVGNEDAASNHDDSIFRKRETVLASCPERMSYDVRDYLTEIFKTTWSRVKEVRNGTIWKNTVSMAAIYMGLGSLLWKSTFDWEKCLEGCLNEDGTIKEEYLEDEKDSFIGEDDCYSGFSGDEDWEGMGIPAHSENRPRRVTAHPLFREKNSYEKLMNLTGLKETKEHIKKIVAYARLKKEMTKALKNTGNMSLNMVFYGNPGTAKTTVARLLGGILFDSGLVDSGQVIEVGRADLVGEYVGHTAGRIKKLFREAEGKILFIDEAYSLEQGRGDRFSEEAVSTIVQEMENMRDRVIVIFAGYEEPMKKFLDMNPGLSSRIPFSVRFPDYSVEELAEITEKLAAEKGFTLSNQAKMEVLDDCRRIVGNEKAGNGRFCRNLVESSILAYAERVFGDEGNKILNDYALTKDDIVMPDIMEETEEKKTGIIGFK